MTRSTIDSLVPDSGFASEEPVEDSALYGGDAAMMVWLPNEHEGNWYSPHVSREVEKQTGRRLSPHFVAHREPSGLIEYECSVNLGHGAWRAAIPSGRHKTTRAALKAIIARINRIPVEMETNWNEQLPILLPYKGMRPPKFRNEAPIGMPAIQCTLEWGIGQDLRTVVSNPCYTRELSFIDAVQQAMKIGPVHAVPSALAQRKPAWEKRVRRQVAALPTGYAIVVRFHSMPESGRVRCQIIWAKGAAGALESLPMRDQQAAFDDAIRLLKKRFPGASCAPKCGEKQVAKFSVSADELLTVAIKRWTVERNFLFRQQTSKHGDTVRLNLLSGFLVVLDPLRCYEIEKTRRVELVRQLHDELAAIAASLSAEAKHEHRIRCLRMLVGSAFKEAGVLVLPGQQMENELRRQGLELDDEIRDLLEARYLRKDADSRLTVTPIGANALEAALTSGVSPRAVVRALPLETATFLTDLHTKLASAKINERPRERNQYGSGISSARCE